MMLRLMLSDAMWQKIGPLLPCEKGRRARPAKDNRLIVEGILWRFRTGAPWRDLPESFGPWGTIYTRFNRWSKAGVWEQAFSALRDDVDDEWNFIDSTIVKAHQHATGAKKGATRPSAQAGVVERLKFTPWRMLMATPFASRSAAGNSMIPRWLNR